MARERTVRVVIDGQEYVSKAAGAADKGVKRFTDRIPGYAKAAAALTAAWVVVGSAVQKAAQIVGDSFRKFDALQASTTRLEAQSKLTGVSLGTLRDAARRARDEFGLAAITANDAATTTAKYASRAGDATRQNELLAAALDLGAASGLTAAETMEALEQGLRGQDEGFDKLLGKNPSALWKEYADANGLAVGKMTDTQKRMAELTAIVDAGNVVTGAYSQRLDTAAGKQELMSNRLDNAQIAFAAALQPVRMLVLQGLTKLIEIATPVVTWVGKIANIVGVSLAFQFQKSRETVGLLVGALGKLIGNDAMEQWGKRTSESALSAQGDIMRMAAEIRDAGTTHVRAADAHEASAERTRVAFDATAGAAARSGSVVAASVTKARDVVVAELGPTLQSMLGVTATAFTELRDTASSSLEPQIAATFRDRLQEVADRSEALRQRITAVKPAIDGANDSARDLSRDITGMARAGLDLAQAFGMADAEAASMLNSVVNMGESLSRVLAGDMAGGITGLIGATANLVTQITGGDRERRRLLRENTDQLGRLTHEVGNLSLGVNSDKLLRAQQALTQVLPRLVGGQTSAETAGRLVADALAQQGLLFGDLKQVADALGISINQGSPEQFFDSLRALLGAIGAVEPGRVGGSFAEQLEFFRQGQQIDGASGVGGLQGLADFVGAFSPALRGLFNVNDLQGSRQALRNLFTSLNNGTGIAPEMLGRLTGEQFRDILLELIQGIDELETTAPPPSSTPPGDAAGVTAPPSDAPPPPPPGPSLEQILADYGQQTVPLFTQQLDAQLRIATATEATAEHTRDIVPALLTIRDLLTTGAIDRMLGAQLDLAQRGRGMATL